MHFMLKNNYQKFVAIKLQELNIKNKRIIINFKWLMCNRLVILVRVIVVVSLLIFSGGKVSAQTGAAVSGTTGTPLGGIGAGAVKFNASKGSFAIMTVPPADAYDFKPVKKAAFQLFTKRGEKIVSSDILKSPIVNGEVSDDAIWPVHYVNFEEVNGIRTNMCAFSPFDNVHYDNMCLPYAFFEMTLTNTQSSPTEVSVALQWESAMSAFSVVKGKGIASDDRAVYVNSSSKNAISGFENATENSFFLNGECSNKVNSKAARAAVKLTLAPQETQIVRFVVSWYEKSDPDLAYYFNLFSTAAEIANHGLENFSAMKSKSEKVVKTIRKSSLPNWLQNQTLNTLANLSTNSMYKKDGRFAFAEGQWTCFGTMDQMWHAQQIIGQLLPYFAWQELRYWARTQMKNGQIHHDHNWMEIGVEKEKRSKLVNWDDTEHTDYRKIEKWVDLNAAMIISTYEIYQMTGDKKQLRFLWPYLKKAGQRMLDQVQEYGSKEYPFTFDQSENSYDAGGDPNPFNASMSAVAYKIMTILGTELKDASLVSTYQDAYSTVVQSFGKRYLNNDGFVTSKHCESYYAGQWLALHLKLGEIWNSQNTDLVLSMLNEYYHPFYKGLGYEKGTYDEWTPYILTHYGGLLLLTNRGNQWYVMQKDAYERQYHNRNLVFNHPLNILPKVVKPIQIASNISSDRQYISIPAIWRNYYDLAGVYKDLSTGSLRVKPILVDSIGREYKNISFFTSEATGTVSCTFSGEYGQNKEIHLSYDKPTKVNTLYLEDNFGEKVVVKINEKIIDFQRTGTGYSKELQLNWKGIIGQRGIRISVTGDKGMAKPEVPQRPTDSKVGQLTSPAISAFDTLQAENATKWAGVEIITSKEGIGYVGSCNNFDYIQFSDVDFGENNSKDCYIECASALDGVIIEIVLDDPAGEVIGNCSIKNTGTFDNYATNRCEIAPVKGIHNLILRFAGGSSEELLRVDKLIFKKKSR